MCCVAVAPDKVKVILLGLLPLVGGDVLCFHGNVFYCWRNECCVAMVMCSITMVTCCFAILTR